MKQYRVKLTDIHSNAMIWPIIVDAVTPKLAIYQAITQFGIKQYETITYSFKDRLWYIDGDNIEYCATVREIT